MFRGERGVKWLDTERRGVAFKSIGTHERESAEAPDIAVVERAAVVQRELDRRVLAFTVREVAGVDEQRTREPRLHDEVLAGRKVQDDELCATPAARDCGTGDALAQLAR